MNIHTKIGLGIILGLILVALVFYLNFRFTSKIESGAQNKIEYYKHTHNKFS